MQSSIQLAAGVAPATAAELALLLSRAYTDEAHLARYTPTERARWNSDTTRVHASPKESMPQEWLGRFPTLRNLALPLQQRIPSFHLLGRHQGHLVGHVSVFPHRFEHATSVARGGFIEDVATEPAFRGNGIASALMGQAVGLAREQGLALLGLSTASPRFYERLGWERWPGSATFVSEDGAERPDHGLMLVYVCTPPATLPPNAGEYLRTIRTLSWE